MILILAYHDITDSDADDYVYATPEGEFKKQIEYLHRRYRIVSAKRACRYVKKNDSLPQKNLAAITFDDALAGAYQNAFPFLIERQIPFTVFAPTKLLGSTVSTKQGNRLVASLRQMQNLAQSELVDIESHGETHTDFVDITLNKAEKEMVESKKFLQEKGLNPSPSLMAYPHAKSDKQIRKKTAEQYDFAFGSGGVINSIQDIDYTNLPRITVSRRMSWWKYKASLTRTFWLLKRLKGSLPLSSPLL